MGSKGHGLWFVIGGFRSGLCVSVFQDPLLVIVIMNDGSGKRNCEDYRVYSHDTTVAILMWKNLFCSDKFAQILATWVNTLHKTAFEV